MKNPCSHTYNYMQHVYRGLYTLLPKAGAKMSWISNQEQWHYRNLPTRMLLSNEKAWTVNSHSSMWKIKRLVNNQSSDWKDDTLHNFYHMLFQIDKTIEIEKTSVFAKFEAERKNLTSRGNYRKFGLMELFCGTTRIVGIALSSCQSDQAYSTRRNSISCTL